MQTLIIGCLGGSMTVIAKALMAKGFKVSHVEDSLSGLNVLGKGCETSIIFVDVGQDVKQLLSSLRVQRFVIPTIVCGDPSVDSSIVDSALEAGAQEFFPFPPDLKRLFEIVRTVSSSNQKGSAFFRDDKSRAAFLLADQVAASEASVLITGESGTGKEVMARYIHSHSDREGRPFICINCAAIPENLLESELFGHEKGAFTGALSRRIGKFEEATSGTLLLDEVSEMPLHVQAKLLRVLQEREVDRLGGRFPIKVDIRVLATSNKDMVHAVQSGEFREDLYFRLNVINIELPPLRERPDDVLGLADIFLEKYSNLNKLSLKHLSKSAQDALLQYTWPGNVRELENTIHRSVLLSKGAQIQEEHLCLGVGSLSFRQNLCVGKTIASGTRDLVCQTLEACGGANTEAARLLGISLRQLHRKVYEYSQELPNLKKFFVKNQG